MANGFPPTATAGVELHTYYLARELAQRHDVSVFAREADPHKPEYSLTEAPYEGIPIRRIVNNYLQVTSYERYFRDEVVDEAFRDCLSSVQPDLVHLQHCVGLSASMVEVAREWGLPVVMTLHDYWYICFRVQLLTGEPALCPGPGDGVRCEICVPPLVHPLVFLLHRIPGYKKLRNLAPLGLRNKAQEWLSTLRQPAVNVDDVRTEGSSPFVLRTEYLRRVLNMADVLTTPSRFVRDRYVAHGVAPEKIRVIPLGLDLSLRQNRERHVPRFRDGPFVFGYIGTLLQHKGIHLLLEAFGGLEREDVELHIYGYGDSEDPYMRKVEDLVKLDPRVRLGGRYDNRKLPTILQNMDAVVVPSLWHETFSIVSREALLEGVPVIASRIGAIPEVVKDGINGLLFRVGDASDLRAKMQWATDHREELGQMGKGGMDTPIRNISDYAAEMEALYVELIREK